ncbi:hypothetical protein GLOIN_2v1779223 [Rhizophagus clarus]|uniref:DNA-directed DNA polymerase n=1 Tax=Rhizophagus clarus TaxID=94130 RepID=A0A8H3L4A2_9GLOM|nr:hypothetical protein GLOIN_2v1779223 [Rhizophagus clarus]
MTKHFKELGYTDEQLDLVYRKGVYPYDYIDSHDRFLETELPLYHEFHSTLKGKITLDDYQHAQKVWKEFRCQNLDATNLYGHSISQYLSIRNYKWGTSRGYLLNNPAMQKKLLNMALKIKPDAKRGCYLNINSHFPLKTHDYLSDLPPAVENIAVEKDWLCPYNAKLVEQLDGGRFSATEN